MRLIAAKNYAGIHRKLNASGSKRLFNSEAGAIIDVATVTGELTRVAFWTGAIPVVTRSLISSLAAS